MKNNEPASDVGFAAPENAFIPAFRSLPEKSASTIRFFERSGSSDSHYYSVYGSDATFTAQEYYKSLGCVKSFGPPQSKLEYVCLSKSAFESFVRELLLVKQYKVEVFVNRKGGGQNWFAQYKLSTENLTQFEELLFSNHEVTVNNGVIGVKIATVDKNKNVGLAHVNMNESIINLIEFVDNDSFTNFESVLVQLSPKEAVILNSSGVEDIATLTKILQRNGVLVNPRPSKEFDTQNIVQDMTRLLKQVPGESNNFASNPAREYQAALSAMAATIKYLSLISNDLFINQFRLEPYDCHLYVKSDSTAGHYDSPSELSRAFPGAKSIYDELHRNYPHIHDPIQLNSVVKFWQGGPDPLDYISCYTNPGNPELNVPPHWHFISYGLTDLHGDGRVHGVKTPHSAKEKEKSGYGFELTFRLRKEIHDVCPPIWPAKLMQQLARYVFRSGNFLLHGDHVSWHQSLDGGESRIQHMLMFEDPQVRPVESTIGTVDFIQIVGITNEELEAVQQWNGPSFLEIIRRYAQCGGYYLVTDMRRGESIFEVDVTVQAEVNAGICKDGSNLSGVTAQFTWHDDAWKHFTFDDIKYLKPAQREKYFRMSSWEIPPNNYEEITETSFSQGNPDEGDRDIYTEENANIFDVNRMDDSTFEGITDDPQNNENILRSSFGASELRMSCESSHSVSLEPTCVEIEEQLETFDCVHLKLNLEASLILPLALKGRIQHGRHFTFKSSNSNSAVTFSCSEFPFRSRGYWLHIYMKDGFTDAILHDFEILMATEGPSEDFGVASMEFCVDHNSIGFTTLAARILKTKFDMKFCQRL